jgi:hypothetical protein
MKKLNTANHLILIIKWLNGIEKIDLPINKEPSDNEITQTEEYWPSVDRTVIYNTTSEREKSKDGSHAIKIHYTKDNNPEFNSLNLIWGTSTIILSANLKSATAEWNCDTPNPQYDGKAPCKILSNVVYNKTERETVSRIKRRQAQFKKDLISLYDRCALTGETTLQALDAAHICEAHTGGTTSVNNGILLRSDLHRLYDAGIFEITMNGTIKITGDISKEYIEILSGKKIDLKILKRISQSLAERAKARTNQLPQ